MPFNRYQFPMNGFNPQRVYMDIILAGAAASVMTVKQGRGFTIVRNSAGDHTLTFVDAEGPLNILGTTTNPNVSNAYVTVLGSISNNGGGGLDIKFIAGAIAESTPTGATVQTITEAVAVKTDLIAGQFLHLLLIWKNTGLSI